VEPACTNCGAEAAGAYCAACGQRRIEPRLTLRGLARDAAAHWLNLDAPLFATFVGMLRDPGGTARAWVEGRRVAFTNPFKYALLAAAAAFASGQWFGTSTIPAAPAPAENLPPRVAEWMARFQERLYAVEPYTAILHFATMPALGIALRALFPRAGRTWVEFYAFALFVSAQESIVEMLAAPFGPRAMAAVQVVFGVLLAWGSYRFTGERGWTVAARALVALGLYMVFAGVAVGVTAAASLAIWP